jgi:hypothetical protein
VEESQRLSFESLKTNILPAIMLVVKHSGSNKVRNGSDGPPLWDRVSALEAAAIMLVVKHSESNKVRNGSDGPPLWDRVSALEAVAKGVSGTATVGKDTFHGVYNLLGGEMGSKAQLDKLVNRLDNLERENTSLRYKVDELTSRSLLKTRTISDDNDALSSGGINLVLERIALLESNQGDGITIAGHALHSALDCKRFLLTKIPTSEEGSRRCPSYDMVALIHGVDKDDSGKSLESVVSRDHHATKGGFSSIGAVIINYQD